MSQSLLRGSNVQIDIQPGQVGTAELADDAVTNPKILDGTIAAAKLAFSPATSGDVSAEAATRSAADDNLQSQVDAIGAGQRFKEAVVVAVSTNVTVANPGTSLFDGVTLSNGDRVLLYGQTTGSQNGTYVFNGSSSALTRATDSDTSAEVDNGVTYPVGSGTKANSFAIQTTNSPTLGSSTLVFSFVSQTPVLNQIPAATGPLSLNSQRITTMADPTAAQDASTKAYVDAQIATITVVAVAASRDLALTDAGKILDVSAAATLTVRLNATVAFPTGSTVYIRQTGTGVAQVAAEGGVTINVPTGSLLKTLAQRSVIWLHKTGTNTWELGGDLAAPTEYRLLAQKIGFINGGTAVGQLYLSPNGTRNSGSTSGADVLFPIDSALFPVGNLTRYCLIEAWYGVNATAETGVTFTWGLYSAGVLSGGVSGTIAMANGTLVTGSQPAALVAPAALAKATIVGTDFAMPADGVYYLGVVTSGATTPAAASIVVGANLWWRAA